MYKGAFGAICLLLLAACQTINPGQGPLDDSFELREAYANCLGSVRGGSVSNYEALVIKPDNKSYVCHWIDARLNMPNLESRYCDEKCNLFAYDGKVVWEGFEAAEKYNKFRAVVDNYLNTFIRFNLSGYSVSELGEKQKEKLKLHNKLFEKRPTPQDHYVLALSPDGESYGMESYSHTAYTRKWRIDYDQKKARKLAIATCNAMSSRDDCVIYAENNKIYE